MTTEPNYEEMNGAELVAAYNVMVNSPEGQQLKSPRNRPVKRFPDHKTAVARTKAMASSIKAVKSGNKANGKDDDPAPKATKKATKKAKPAATPKEVKPHSNPIVASFGARAGTNREKLLELFVKKLNKPIKVDAMLTHIYGEADPDMKGALNMIVKGVQTMIDAKKLPYKVVKDRKAKTQGLFDA